MRRQTKGSERVDDLQFQCLAKAKGGGIEQEEVEKERKGMGTMASVFKNKKKKEGEERIKGNLRGNLCKKSPNWVRLLRLRK